MTHSVKQTIICTLVHLELLFGGTFELTEQFNLFPRI